MNVFGIVPDTRTNDRARMLRPGKSSELAAERRVVQFYLVSAFYRSRIAR